MPELQPFPLTTASGATGRVYRRSRFLDPDETSLVRLDNGQEFQALASALRVEPDGTFFLQDEQSSSVDILTEESPGANEIRRGKPTGMQNEIVVDEPLFAEEAAVERVVVNRLMDEPAEIRQEGDLLIIPVIEEVITVQKRYLLKEEVRVLRRRSDFREPRRVVVQDADTHVIGADGREIPS